MAETPAVNPLADRICAWVDAQIAEAGTPLLLLISGAQGIGKSTAMMRLARHPGRRIATASLDDFYIPKAERHALARRIHPLCSVRGPPGTHDLGLLQQTLGQLFAAVDDSQTPLPLFDKIGDDCSPRPSLFRGKPEAIVLEGWLMGALPDPAAAADRPVNRLEAVEDRQGIWRAWQEQALADGYQQLFRQADAMLHLDAPGWETVPCWRMQQEAHMMGCQAEDLPADRRAWVTRFVMHFERISRRMLAGRRHPGEAIAVDGNRLPRDLSPKAG